MTSLVELGLHPAHACAHTNTRAARRKGTRQARTRTRQATEEKQQPSKHAHMRSSALRAPALARTEHANQAKSAFAYGPSLAGAGRCRRHGQLHPRRRDPASARTAARANWRHAELLRRLQSRPAQGTAPQQRLRAHPTRRRDGHARMQTGTRGCRRARATSHPRPLPPQARALSPLSPLFRRGFRSPLLCARGPRTDGTEVEGRGTARVTPARQTQATTQMKDMCAWRTHAHRAGGAVLHYLELRRYHFGN